MSGANQAKILLLLGLFLTVAAVVQTPGSWADPGVTITADRQFSYAQHLFNVRDFSSAVNEYRRFAYLFPGDKRSDSAVYQIGLCYLALGQPEPAIASFTTLTEGLDGSPLAEKAYFRISEAYLALGRTGSAVTTLQNLATLSEVPDTRDRAHYRIGWIYLEAAQWEPAQRHFARISPANTAKYRVDELKNLLEKRSDRPRKRPWLAGTLSVVPGGGYLYCGRYQDALIAFLLNAGLIYAAYEAFEHELYALSGVIALVEFGFYSGNIYGGISSAHKYNRDRDRQWVDYLRENLRVTASYRPAADAVELSLRLPF